MLLGSVREHLRSCAKDEAGRLSADKEQPSGQRSATMAYPADSPAGDSVRRRTSSQLSATTPLAGTSEKRLRRRWRTQGRSTSLKHVPGVQPPTRLASLKHKTMEEERLIAASLRNNPAIRRVANFTEEQIQYLVDSAWKEDVQDGWILMSEGSLHNAVFHIVAHGSFEVEAHEQFEVVDLGGMLYLSRPAAPPTADVWRTRKHFKTVRRVGRLGSFGAPSMIYGTPRLATVTAREKSEVWTICHADFRAMQLQALQQGGIPQKSLCEEKLLAEALSGNDNLQPTSRLDNGHVEQLVAGACREEVPAGRVIMQEGELNANCFYILSEGQMQVGSQEAFRVVRKEGLAASFLCRPAEAQADTCMDQASVQQTAVLEPGAIFGEESMLNCAPRTCTAQALTHCVLWSIDRSTFQNIQMAASEDHLRGRVKYLEGIDSLSAFSKEERQKIAGAMEWRKLAQDAAIASKGSPCLTFFVLLEGTVRVTGHADAATELTADPEGKIMHYFGRDAIEGDATWQENIVVTSASASALVLEYDTFHKVWDRLLEAAPRVEFKREPTSSKLFDKTRGLTLENLEMLGDIGTVEFLGSVRLCQHRKTHEVYVLKSMSKGLLSQKGFRKALVRERMLWMEMISPFIVRMSASFNEPHFVSYLLEAALGGELSTMYAQRGLYGNEDAARYYVAGVLLALEHMHKRCIIYRNIKPRNVLLDARGRPKITDMALAKLVPGYTFTTCGTPFYMAPEIISGIGHNRAVDWWALGCLACELVTEHSPFEAELPMEVYARVMQGVLKVRFDSCSEDLRSLLVALLKPQAVDRLPMLQGGPQNVIDHAWFRSFDWAAMRSGSLRPPAEADVPPSPMPPKEMQEGLLAQFSTWADPLPVHVECEDEDIMWEDEFAS
eukprot:TRINITY_DN16820_c0_g2_i1.p1 TRINITY_DN16820_c0_g2~~TRINITY_DN16820_c0_g2_i1.p1  ORF type:complete len:895 (+),score=210.36 TRINITY_DN16820_c0_g2_i1:105-2789(+)